MKKVYSNPSLCIKLIYTNDILTTSVEAVGDTTVSFSSEWIAGGGF